MNYTQAMSEVEGGKYAWRSSWPIGEYIYGWPTVMLYRNNGQGIVYQPTEGDKEATDWDGGDKGHP
jgi:hypothetical protein